jgi:parallel beta-helix repeat protein
MKYSACVCTIIIILFFTAIPVGIVQASTDVNGIITKDTTWTKAGSPYTLTGPVAVNKGVTLTIESGVIVNLNSYKLQINGTLNAIGRSSEKIYLNGDDKLDDDIQFTLLSQSWNENTQSGSIMENCVFNFIKIDINGTSPKIDKNVITGFLHCNCCSSEISNNIINSSTSYGIDTCSSSALISGNTIYVTRNTYSGIYTMSDSSTITDNMIIGSASASETTGITSNGGNGNIISGNTIFGYNIGIIAGYASTIYSNLIINNTIGIKSGSFCGAIEKNTITYNTIGIYLMKTECTQITNNNIYDNAKYNLQLFEENNEDIAATNNWWGTTDISTIGELIYDNKDNYNLGTVTYTPVLTSADSQAPVLTDEIQAQITAFTATVTPSPSMSGSETANPTATATSSQTNMVDSSGSIWENWVVAGLVVAVAVLAVGLVLVWRRLASLKGSTSASA